MKRMGTSKYARFRKWANVPLYKMSLYHNKDAGPIVDHLFRNEAGKMVAVLTRLFGFSNLEQAEDIVHDTLLNALETWRFGNIPANPEAWLYKVAKNKAIDLIRRQKLRHRIENDLSLSLQSEYTLVPVINEQFGEKEITDNVLRMMFACCQPSISSEAQITLILNVLCGLNSREISKAFLTSEEGINKRLYRTKKQLRNENIVLDYPLPFEIDQRIESVLKSLYLLFSEGYNSAQQDQLIREDLCEEALRLAIILTDHPKTNLPQTHALIALMCYQASRLKCRLNDAGFIILLKDQDRVLWNKALIQKGNDYLVQSAKHGLIHEYQVEAAIASVHANAVNCESTDWELILHLYDLLLRLTNNPVVALNRCLVFAEIHGPETAIIEMEKIKEIASNFYYKTSLADLYLRAGNHIQAKQLFIEARNISGSVAEKELLDRKISLCY